MRKIYIRFLTTALFLSFALPALGMSPKTGIVKQQKGIEDQFSYTDLLALFPANTTILRGLAKAAKRKDDHSRVIIFLEQLTVHFPLEKELWKDLAHAYTALGNAPAARNALEKAGETNGTTKKASLTDIHVQVGAGVLCDDNIFFQPSQKTICLPYRRPYSDLPMLSLKYDLSDKKYRAKRSWGKYAWGSLQLNKRFTPQGVWSVTLNANGHLKRYNNFDTKTATSILLATGLRYTTKNCNMTLQGTLKQYGKNTQKKLVESGVEAVLSNRLFSRVYHVTKGALVERKNQEIKNVERNASYGWLGQYLNFLWAKNELMLGARLIINKAKKAKYETDTDLYNFQTDTYSYNAWQSSVLTNYTFSDTIKLQLKATIETRYYNTSPMERVVLYRKDRRISAGAGFSYFFTKNICLETEYNHFRNRSKIAIFDYDKNVFSSGLTWYF